MDDKSYFGTRGLFKPRLKPEGVKAYEAMRHLAEWLNTRFAEGPFPEEGRELLRILDQ